MPKTLTTKLKKKKKKEKQRQFPKRVEIDTSGAGDQIKNIAKLLKKKTQVNFGQASVFDYNDLADKSENLVFPGTVAVVYLTRDKDGPMYAVFANTVDEAYVAYDELIKDAVLTPTGGIAIKTHVPDEGKYAYKLLPSPLEKDWIDIDQFGYDAIAENGYDVRESSQPVRDF